MHKYNVIFYTPYSKYWYLQNISVFKHIYKTILSKYCFTSNVLTQHFTSKTVSKCWLAYVATGCKDTALRNAAKQKGFLARL